MCRVLAYLDCRLDSFSHVEDVLCLSSHSFSAYWTRVAFLLRCLPLCRASVKLSTCTCEEIPLEGKEACACLPHSMSGHWGVCVVYPPRLSFSYLHLGVACHAASPPRNLPSVNIALILSVYAACNILKSEAGVLRSYQAYSAAAGGAPSLAAPRY